MVRDALRHLAGRRSRSGFTVAGIAVGILALVVVGSLAERLHEIVARSTALNEGLVFASVDRDVLLRPDAPARLRRAGEALRGIAGVAAVVPEVVLPARPDGTNGGRLGPPSLIFGVPAGAAPSDAVLRTSSGRGLVDGDRRTAVVGADLAAADELAPGALVALYGNAYRVVGVYAKSFTLFDQAFVVPLVDAQRLALQRVPPYVERLPQGAITTFVARVAPGADPSAVAARINTLESLRAQDPAQIARTVRSTLGIFDAVVFGAALVALVIAAFSIVNTMTTAVTERTREIGIRKAIGATDAAVLREFVVEAAAIGVLGGLAGIVLGAVLVSYVDARSGAGGNAALFALSPRVVAGGFAFAVALSVLAGLVPALRAARLPPSEALRHA